MQQNAVNLAFLGNFPPLTNELGEMVIFSVRAAYHVQQKGFHTSFDLGQGVTFGISFKRVPFKSSRERTQANIAANILFKERLLLFSENMFY